MQEVPHLLWGQGAGAGAVWDNGRIGLPGNTPLPHTCYHAEFGRRSNGKSILLEIRR